MTSNSGETVATILSALHTAVNEQTIIVDTSMPENTEIIQNAIADRIEYNGLIEQWSQRDENEIILELPLPTRAAKWLPESLQKLIPTPIPDYIEQNPTYAMPDIGKVP